MDKLNKKFRRKEQTVFSMANCVCLCNRGGCPCNQVDYDYMEQYTVGQDLDDQNQVFDFRANWT